MELRLLSIQRRTKENSLLLNQVTIRFGERHAKFYALCSARIEDRTAPQARGVQCHEKPLGSIDNEELRIGGAANEIRTAVPADLHLSLAFLDLKLDGLSAAPTDDPNSNREQRQARNTGHAGGNPFVAVRPEMPFGILQGPGVPAPA